MGARRLAIVIDATDTGALRDFWVQAAGYEAHGQAGQYCSAVDPDGVGPKLVFQEVPEQHQPSKNRLHIDIVVGDHLASEAERLVALGARQLTDTIEEVGTQWVVMADPEGNEFCLVYDG